MQTTRYYFTPTLQIGEFVRTTDSKPELYELKIGETTKRYLPSALVLIPTDKLYMIKPRKYGN